MLAQEPLPACAVDDDASEDLVRLVCAPSWRSAFVAAAGAPSHTVLEALVAVVEVLAVVASILSRRTNGLSESRGWLGLGLGLALGVGLGLEFQG